MPVPHLRSTGLFFKLANRSPDLPDIPVHRPIRSYVLRQGRITPAQEQAIKQHWGFYGIEYKPELLKLNQVYARSAPKILDVGAGMGDNTIALATEHRENDYLAIEVHTPGVGKLIKQAASLNLSNIRVICHDVVDVLNNQLEDHSLDMVLIFFPDPWPKKRHHKRRLIQAEFMSLLIPKLQAHGRIFIATDWQNLAEHIMSVCDQNTNLKNIAGMGNYTPRPKWRPLTKFELRGKQLHHKVWDLAYAINR